MNDAAIIGIIVVTVVAYFFVMKTRASGTNNAALNKEIEQIESEWDKELRESQQHLGAALSACQKDHSLAADALCWLAAADGTVSKQELRVLLRFCEEQGTQINKAAFKAIDNLNAGMSMKVRTTESEAHQAITALSEKPAAYRLAFYGAANKIVGSQKRLSEAKRRFIEAASAIIH